jgi:hypothetical protein
MQRDHGGDGRRTEVRTWQRRHDVDVLQARRDHSPFDSGYEPLDRERPIVGIENRCAAGHIPSGKATARRRSRRPAVSWVACWNSP